jgi:hypothetical protein
VQINPVDNGFIVSVGCKTLVFPEASIDEMLADLKVLLQGGERELRKKYFPKQEEPEVDGTMANGRIGQVDNVRFVESPYPNECVPTEKNY